MTFRPMLAENAVMERLKFPYLVSPKLDGFRAVMQDGILKSRNLKPIRNPEVSAQISHYLDLDGELCAGDPREPGCFKRTSSIVTTNGANIDSVKFYVFDRVGHEGFAERLAAARDAIEGQSKMVLVPHVLVMDYTSLCELEDQTIREGYEGLMLRDPKGPYKQGRSTVSENWLLKLKRFEHGEARIKEVFEEMENRNEAKVDALGYTERSSHQANKVGKGCAGGFEVKDLQTGVEFSVGTGLDAAARRWFWDHREEVKGWICLYKWQKYGTDQKPRTPVFLGARPPEDEGRIQAPDSKLLLAK